MANPGDSSHEKSVPEKGRDASENESPGRERRDITPTPQVPGEEEGAKEVPGERERTVAPAAEGPVEKKRGRKDDAGASCSSGVEKKRKKGELLEIPNRSPSCYLCGRKFQSWKAVFGHMRAHKIGEERVRGAFPPPVFTPPGSPQRVVSGLQEQLAPTLLNIAQEVLQGPRGQSSSVSRGLNIDLNQQPPHHESPSTSTPSSPKKDGGRKLDLNKPPAPEGGDGDGDGGAGSA
ncbi:uncharacterized protein LOC116127750 [Pistacia vera]|uniref:uncharacterized protein LOC116127750 n=1 Tax=Pistacia vera TaxID=55513 RepID=UPI0012636AB1|nr:uncharacterized protein LOC116127750 [Pistacia vera]